VSCKSRGDAFPFRKSRLHGYLYALGGLFQPQEVQQV
jgi:hypothetical protein